MHHTMKRYLKLLLQLFLAPKQGWEDLSAEQTDPDDLMRRGLYPLAAVAALMSFLGLVYHADISPMSMLLKAVVEFGAWIVGYFIAVFALSSGLPQLSDDGVGPSLRCIKLFSVCMIGLMAVIGLLRNLLPSDYSIIWFLYFYLAIIIWRGERFMKVAPDKRAVFVILAVVSVIVPPLLIMLL